MKLLNRNVIFGMIEIITLNYLLMLFLYLPLSMSFKLSAAKLNADLDQMEN